MSRPVVPVTQQEMINSRDGGEVTHGERDIATELWPSSTAGHPLAPRIGHNSSAKPGTVHPKIGAGGFVVPI
jgi:hypothetical protein